MAGSSGTEQDHNLNGSDAVDVVLRTAIEQSDVPGAVALITDRDGVLYQGAFGVADVASHKPLSLGSMFRIASMSKPITSLAVMQLAEQGKLRLEDAAEQHLPVLGKLKVIESFDVATGGYVLRHPKGPPTVKQLLTHTSGLGYPFTSSIIRDIKLRPGDEQPFGGPLLFDPGERWHYGTSTDVAGALVEAVSGQTLVDFFREHIFTPLKMSDTSYNVPQNKESRLVAAQRRGGDKMDGVIEVQHLQPGLTIESPIGGGGLVSTANDYGRFLRAFLNGGELDGARVAMPETIAAMSRNAAGDIRVPALKTALPRSADFSFINDGRDQWSLGFLITADQVPGKRSPGSLSWGGINNTYFWIDPERGIAGTILMQYLPFADTKALAVYDAFERAAYELIAQ